MSASQLERVFEPFDRAGAEQSGVEGTGLGLALCRRLVEAMGGTIEVASEPGSGSTFTVELERAEAPALEPEAEPRLAARERSALEEHALQQRTLLYIEDNLSSLKLIEALIERIGGARVITAMQGKLGLELARRRRPDLVLLDLHLPDIDGAEVLERLRGDPATREIPVVIVSADATEGQAERLLAAGAAAYITKPIDVPRLLEVLGEQLGERSGAGAG
jgi:CheY-like chemotaxis protein